MNLLKRLYVKYILKKTPDDLELEYLVERGMRVGTNCQIYSLGSIDHIYPHLISIGNDVIISTNVTILAHDASTNVVGCGTKLGRVEIGNNVFVGTGTIILCNTRIGSNVVVGAGSVVTCDLEDNFVYAGVPAKKICSIDQYRQKTEALRVQRPDLSEIRPWYEWYEAPQQDRKKMADLLSDGVGFI